MSKKDNTTENAAAWRRPHIEVHLRAAPKDWKGGLGKRFEERLKGIWEGKEKGFAHSNRTASHTYKAAR